MGERGKVKAIRVHKAVAETFIPNPNNLPIVHHKDENRANPDISNLQWATHKENMKYHYDKLKNKTSYYNNRKLNENDILEIKKYASMGFSRRKIANMFNVSKTTIINLLNGKSYNYM